MVKFFILICFFSSLTYSAPSNQELSDQFDEFAESLEKERPLSKADKDLEEIELDDWEAIKTDLTEGAKGLSEKEKRKGPLEVVNESTESEFREPIKISVFDTAKEEKELLELAKKIGHKISQNEWDEIVQTTSQETYRVVEDDTLWSISKTLFGTGFLYSKIWSLNPYITNPHEIEPGMVLAFSLGSEESSPEIKLGSFSLYSIDSQKTNDVDLGVKVAQRKGGNGWEDILSDSTKGEQPRWFREREKLIKEGHYVGSSSDFTFEDLKNLSSLSLLEEYKNYEPPKTYFKEPVPETIDSLGFDVSSVLYKKIPSGFHLTTFLSSNIVQDLGEIRAGQKSSPNFGLYDIVYVKFDSEVNVSSGDQFSIYVAEGTVKHKSSERKGHRYTIKGHIRVNKKKNDLWECEVTYIVQAVYRHDRITLFTPPIDKILTTFNQQNIEAVVVDSYNKERSLFSYGDVVYIDRGRADGVELGNIFALYSFRDRYNNKKITPDPTYQIGELTVITLTDNFSTVLVSASSTEINFGQLAITKTLEQALLEKKKKAGSLKYLPQMEKEDLEEIDVELDLDHLENKLKEKAEEIELSEDELEELERIEREKSFLEEHKRDRKELNRLEKEIEESEGLLNEAVEDQNKQLEQQDLDVLEDELKSPDPNAFESLDEIEEEVGKKYLDENLNEKENPYGLTEFDLEEVDELLNTAPPKEGKENIEKGEILE